MASSGEFSTKPLELITPTHLKEVLKIDKGVIPDYRSYTVVRNLAGEGSRFGSRTLLIKVDYTDSGENLQELYVVKLYSAPDCILRDVYDKLFESEVNFYINVLPQMNETLKSANQPPLHIPKYLHSAFKESSALIYFKDLGQKGFRCREAPFDEAHVQLVVEELARFHAASMILISNEGLTCKNVSQNYTEVNDCIPKLKVFLQGHNINMIESSFKTGIAICDKLDEHTYVSEYLRSIEDVDKTWEAMIKPTDKFMAIRHGNLKSNNVMFRYMSETSTAPLEVSFVDFQMVGIGPQTLDLHQLLFPCLDTEHRITKTQDYLASYFAMCKDILPQRAVRFSQEELATNYQAKQLFGFVLALCLIPLSMMKPEEVPDMTRLISNSEREDEMTKYRANVSAAVASHEKKEKLLFMFDQLQKEGFFKH